MFESRLVRSLCSKKALYFQVLMIFLWGAQLLNSDAYYVNYLLLLIITSICFYQNIKSNEFVLCKNHESYQDTIVNGFSLLFACMVTFANFKVWSYANTSAQFKFCFFVFSLVAGFCAFWNIFNVIVSNIERITWKGDNGLDKKTKQIFIVTFLLITLSRFFVLYFCQYPGVLTYDSINQISQILSGNYSNAHPFYHTQVIHGCMFLGMKLFDDINAAVATYSIFQILFTTTCFSLAVSTMALMKVPKWIVLSSIIFFLFMPYHIMYSITMWKDVMFGCFVLLWIIFFYKCLEITDNPVINHVGLALSCLGICLFRSNGFFAFSVLTLAYLVIWKTEKKKILLIFCSVIILSLFMKYVVLKQINVAQPETIEFLSIPAQQIARVVQEGHTLNDSEKKLLSEVIEIRRIPKVYKPFISDPIKGSIQAKGNQKIFSDRKWDFIKLYFSLGCRYPKSYVRAWIDQTRGYWNAGYEYWRWEFEVRKNKFGIAKIVRNKTALKIISKCFNSFTDIQGLRLFISIGFFVWVDMIMLFIALIRKDKIGAFISLPVLSVVISLLIATPVFAEFRYIYAVFCSLPIIVVIVMRPIDRIKVKA